MKSFVGLLHGDGSAPDSMLLRHLATSIRLPASSEPSIEIEGAFGIAAVSHRGEPRLPLIARDGSVRLAGDTDDNENILRAWSRWRSDCVAHLFGDYSFALWDGDSGELFCARDRFGVRPFYYARIDRGIVFSDSLEAVIAHPDTNATELDDGAVADYLVGGVYEDAEATIYAHVRRLAPAHVLRWCRGGEVSVSRYWTLRAPDATAPRGDEPALLAAALEEAIRDRLNASAAVVFMSGGLDSSTLAALTREIRPDIRLLAATSVYRSRIADVEERYAVEAARSIGIAIRCFPLDDYPPMHALEAGLWTADPGALLTASMTRDIYASVAEHAPVALHGHPADAVLAVELTPFLRKLRLPKLGSALLRYVAVRRRPPWFFFRDLLHLRRGRMPPAPPEWLRMPRRVQASDEGAKPLAIRALESPMWSSFFEWAHPLQTRAPIEVAYPWSDPRVIEAVLAMSPIPWRVEKHVVREMLRGRVSETIRARKKTFVQGDPWIVALPDDGRSTVDIDIEAASRYIDPERFRESCRASGALADATLRAVAFEYWLRKFSSKVRILQGGIML